MYSDVYFVGVDVGTGSSRAALITSQGKIVNTHVEEIKTWNPKPDYYEQSSDDIWNACIKCIKNVVKQVPAEKIKGIGFDATCSLVAIDTNGKPLSVSLTGKNEQNVILWMDHRAKKEAEKINALNHPVLRYVGGKISLEMETPKLLWLKTHLRETWDKVGLYFDLPDFLTWKATGHDSRSSCSLVCKWTYEIQSSSTQGWNEIYLIQIGLEDLIEDNFKKIGSKVFSPGTAVGNGITDAVAKELGLLPKTAVGTSLIDAHAGGLGLFGCSSDAVSNEFHTRLGLICGTSTCHMAVSPTPVFTPGVWGPYYNAMIPGMWLNEGGQSATGKLLDHIIDSHPATPAIKKKNGDMHIQHYLNNVLEKLRKNRGLESTAFLTKDLHVWPDFHGNRSPIADPDLKGSISGLSLSVDEESLAVLYLATVQALCYGTKHILEALITSGHSDIKSILICGGVSKNPLFVQTQADIVNLPVLCPEVTESVLLGSAILGACAAGHFSDMENAIRSMGGSAKAVNSKKNVYDFHKKKYQIFLQMLKDQQNYKDIMNSL